MMKPEANVNADRVAIQKARELIDKLDAIHADEHYKSVWLCYANHGGDYRDGPKYDKELAALREAVEQAERILSEQAVTTTPNQIRSVLRVYLNRAESRLNSDTRSADFDEIIALRDAVRTVQQIHDGARGNRGNCESCDAIALLLDGGPPVPDELSSESASVVSPLKQKEGEVL